MKSFIHSMGLLSMVLGFMLYAPQANAAHRHGHKVAHQHEAAQHAHSGDVANHEEGSGCGCCEECGCENCGCEEGCQCCQGGECTCENCECECCEGCEGGCKPESVQQLE